MTTFTSKSASLSIVVKASRYAYNNDGSRYFVPGKRAEFHFGSFSTDDEEIIAFLKNHRDFGVLFLSDDQAVSPEVMQSKSEAKRIREQQLAKKTEAKATNKKLPSEGGVAQPVDPNSDEAVAAQIQNETLIP